MPGNRSIGVVAACGCRKWRGRHAHATIAQDARADLTVRLPRKVMRAAELLGMLLLTGISVNALIIFADSKLWQ
jgi:hypothetical protein